VWRLVQVFPSMVVKIGRFLGGQGERGWSQHSERSREENDCILLLYRYTVRGPEAKSASE